MTEIEKKLRQELKDQIEENKELLKINEEHKKINGELRKEIDGLITVIDLAKEYIRQCQLGVDGMDRPYMLLDQPEGRDLLEILERVNEE